jgi:patatin-related protein
METTPATAQWEPTVHEREVRFAVVIYGGVSLAIYINGIVQEMLRMVRATTLPPEKLSKLELVYRKLGCLIAVEHMHPSAGMTGDEVDREIRILDEPAATPRTRFVVDILSGTSAGGINSLFMAKALARGQSLQNLAQLWIETGDISKLLNDRGSVEGVVDLQRPPRSLLNARWMYLKLLEAFDNMETGDIQDGPLVGDIDVYLTTTDLDGLPLPLALPHQKVEERRHRNVYKFSRRDEGVDPETKPRDDFGVENNPFFAFAARCTSAFPFAFEPMTLSDIFPVVQAAPLHRDKPYASVATHQWERFYSAYMQDPSPGITPFPIRAFGDGGYLDNKPFTYAIDEISRRSADVPVDRKLIYIEPSPEDQSQMFRPRKDASDRMDAVQNSLAALITLPRYETIREDLMRLLAWNKEVARLKRVLREIRIPDQAPENYQQQYSFVAYQRLRVSATTDQMAERVSVSIGLDPSSGRAEALRSVIGEWRRAKWPQGQEQEFLDIYDFDYLIRAAQYLRRRIRRDTTSTTQQEDLETVADIKRLVRWCLEGPLPALNVSGMVTPKKRDEDLDMIVMAGMTSDRNPGQYKEASRDRALEAVDKGWGKVIEAAHERLRQHFEGSRKAHDLLEKLFAKYGGKDTFLMRDSVVFPITFNTLVGEFTEIDVVRISPKDVSTIQGVTDEGFNQIRGQSFGAFGAFLDQGWRKHDILRGRLDGAEILIRSILPGSQTDVVALREQITKEAMEAIAAEVDMEMGGGDQ